MLILVLSKSAIESPHVLREVERASSKRRPLLSIRIDAAQLPPDLEYFLSANHWLDASRGPIEQVLPALIGSVRGGDGGNATREALGVGTPGARTARDALPTPAPSKVPSRWGARATAYALAVLAAGVVYMFADKFWLAKRATAPAVLTEVTPPAPVNMSVPQADKSIAVLPFVDMSEKKDQEYFSNGLSEELIDLLAHSTDLKVIARTSSFQFKGKNEDMRTIGQRLGVTNLLDGSVRTSGKTVRVTVQLIKVSDGSHRWSQTYDRDMRDIFKVQDAIASAVVTALKETMATGTQPPQAIAANTEAYKAVLRGRYFRQKETKEDSERSIAAFQEALRLDPNYAIALAELGRTYNMRGLDGWMLPKEAYAKAREAIDRALKIDPQLALAHRALSAIEYNFTRNFALSRAEEKRAYELDPSNPAVTLEAGVDAIARGQPNEAVSLFLGSLPTVIRSMRRHARSSAGHCFGLTD